MSDNKEKNGIEALPDGSIRLTVWPDIYVLPPSTNEELVADVNAVNEKLRREKKGPIESVLPEIEKLKGFPELQQRLLDKAYSDLRNGASQNHVSNDEMRDFLNTMPGIVYSMGLAFRRHYPDITDTQIFGIIARIGAAEAIKARNAIHQNAIDQQLGKDFGK